MVKRQPLLSVDGAAAGRQSWVDSSTAAQMLAVVDSSTARHCGVTTTSGASMYDSDMGGGCDLLLLPPTKGAAVGASLERGRVQRAPDDARSDEEKGLRSVPDGRGCRSSPRPPWRGLPMGEDV